MSETDQVLADVRDQLKAVDQTQGRTREFTAQAGPKNGLFLCLMGLLFGGLGLAVGLTVHTTPVGLIIAIVAFVAILQVLMFWRQKTKKATGLGWSRHSSRALAITLILYSAGVFVAAFQAVGPSVAFWLPYALLTAAPVVAAGLKDLRSS